MNYTVHPDPECQREQAKFLAECPVEDRRFHELLFKRGNITYHYHLLARTFQPTEQDFQEWLEGLAEPMKGQAAREGFEKAKRVLAFTRYVNEKNDVGLEAFIAEHLDPADLADSHRLLG